LKLFSSGLRFRTDSTFEVFHAEHFLWQWAFFLWYFSRIVGTNSEIVSGKPVEATPARFAKGTGFVKEHRL
jgi:hypothetical protein